MRVRESFPGKGSQKGLKGTFHRGGDHNPGAVSQENRN